MKPLCIRMSFLFLVLVSLFLTQGCGDSDTSGSSLELKLSEGQTANIPEKGLKIEVTKVIDLTSQGCLGGLLGCPSSAQLKVSKNIESKEITLQVPRTQNEKEQGVNQTDIFGSRIVLESLKVNQIKLSVQ